MPSKTSPDYELADQLMLKDPAQYRALFEETRKEIVSLLLERAATTTELAKVLEKPKGTVGHHLSVLAEAGLVQVVRTQQVRGFVAKYYGRTARVFLYEAGEHSGPDVTSVMGKAAAQIQEATQRFDPSRVMANSRYARISAEQYARWHERMNDLLLEFMNENEPAEQTHALVVGLYPVAERRLGDDE